MSNIFCSVIFSLSTHRFILIRRSNIFTTVIRAHFSLGEIARPRLLLIELGCLRNCPYRCLYLVFVAPSHTAYYLPQGTSFLKKKSFISYFLLVLYFFCLIGNIPRIYYAFWKNSAGLSCRCWRTKQRSCHLYGSRQGNTRQRQDKTRQPQDNHKTRQPQDE